jgi:hypothetical protein
VEPGIAGGRAYSLREVARGVHLFCSVRQSLSLSEYKRLASSLPLENLTDHELANVI